MHAYGQPPPPPKRGLGTGAIVAIVVACMFGGCVVLGAIGTATRRAAAPVASAMVEPKASPPPTVAPKPRAEPLPVTAADLFAAYQANEVAADDRYKGRELLVTGTVADVKKDFTDSIIIGLRTSNQFMPIDAHIEDSEKAKGAKLSKGASVSLRCEGHGMVMGRPQLGGCAFE